jgi:anti-sigma regulatory factor (Ser/Thr protein kinase)
VLVLTDHGPGIPDINIAMSEGFSTAPDNIRALGFGAGMGLPNIKRYSDELDIQSELGKGTKITITVYS